MLKLHKCISLCFINAYHYKCIPLILEELNKSDCSKAPSAPIQSSTLWRLSRPIPAHATSPAIHYKHGWSTHLAGLVNSVSASCWSRLRESAFSESSQRGPSSKTRKGVAPNVCKPCRGSANRLIGLSVLLQLSVASYCGATPQSSRPTLEVSYAGCRTRTCCSRKNREPSSKPAQTLLSYERE